jgi:hypothetical protein
MSENTAVNHDRLFKELLSIFFREFIELFLPEVAAYTDFSTLAALDKEIFTDVTEGERHESDIIMQVRFKPNLGGRPKRAKTKASAAGSGGATFLLHVENQSTSRSNFSRRMFIYFSRLYEKYGVDIYPIAVLSFDAPTKKTKPNYHHVDFPDKRVLDFNFAVIQLNQLDWRDFVNKPNPIASALMAKMKIAPTDRVRVKLECLRMLTGLELDPARTQVVYGFVNTYLRLDVAQKQEFEVEISQLASEVERERIMQVVNEWTEAGITQGKLEGITQGKLEGKLEGEQELVLRLLRRKLGPLTPELEQQVSQLELAKLEALGEALLDFNSPVDLVTWLASVK